MTLIGGKRKVNKSLKAWVAFVKKVQKEEKLSYKDAIHRAKVRKDKGEKWMMGGSSTSTISDMTESTSTTAMDIDEEEELPSNVQKRSSENDMSIQTKYQSTPQELGRVPTVIEDETIEEDIPLEGTTVGEAMSNAEYGGKRRRTMRKGKARSARRGRARTARKSRGRGRGRGRGRH
jgi:hypothetical protein